MGRGAEGYELVLYDNYEAVSNISEKTTSWSSNTSSHLLHYLASKGKL